MTKVERSAEEFAAIVPGFPSKCSRWDAVGSLRWWVDLTCKDPQRIQFISSVGLPSMNHTDLQGYGFSVDYIEKEISLLGFDRASHDSLARGSEVFTLYLFLREGAFYFPEIKAMVVNHFRPKILHYAATQHFAALRVKMIRMVKVGFVQVGYFEEFYVHQGTLWRDREHASLPIIFNTTTDIVSDSPREFGSFITSSDLE